jgi:sporulation protein YlmC with PRC-barrel domain
MEAMATNLQMIDKGMEVYDSMGEKIGSVADVYAVAAESQTSTLTPTSTAGTMFKVNEGGVLGIGATVLYVPFNAVANVDPGDSVTLNCTQADAERQYATKPDFLESDR